MNCSNLDHLICEAAEKFGYTFGEAEKAFKAQARKSARAMKVPVKQIYDSFERMNPEQLAKAVEIIVNFTVRAGR